MGRSSPTSPSACASTTTHTHTTAIIITVAMLFCLLLPSPVSFLSDHYAYSPSTLLKSLLDPTFKYDHPSSSYTSSQQQQQQQQQQQPQPPQSYHQPSIYPRCNHMILVTAARHGSTWMIDNIEQCTFSLLRNGTDFGRCNLFSELWMPSHKGPLLNISVDHVLDYVASLMSIKVFPRVWMQNRPSIMTLLARSRAVYPLPVVILRRNLTYAYRSQQRAQKRGKWNSNVKPVRPEVSRRSMGTEGTKLTLKSVRDGVLDDDDDEEMEEEDEIGDVGVDENPNALTYFIRDREKYFEEVASFLTNHSIPFDTITYENVRHVDIIELPVARCHVVNCNSSRRR